MKIKVALISLILVFLSACGNRDMTLPTSSSNALQGSTPADLEVVEWQE